MNCIKKIEHDVLGKKKLKINTNIYKNTMIIPGDFIIVWYLSRNSLKGVIIYQFFKGLCIGVRNRTYNSKILLRNVMGKVALEYNFFLWNINNICIVIKKNKLSYYRSNKLYFLRKKINKKSRFKIPF